MKTFNKYFSVLVAMLQLILVLPVTAFAADGDAIASLDFSALGNSVISGNSGASYIQLGTGGTEGKLEARTFSAIAKTNGLVNPDFVVNGNSFTLDFDAQFNSLVTNVHGSYWIYNGLGIQLSYRDSSNVLKTFRVNFTKLDGTNNKVNVVVGKGGLSFNFAGPANPNFTNMIVDLDNPNASHKWTMSYDSAADTMTILLDGEAITSGGVELEPVLKPWFVNTNTTFNAVGLTVTNVLYSTSTSYVAAGTNNNVLLDNFVLKNGAASTKSIKDIADDTWAPLFEGYTNSVKQYSIENGSVALSNLTVQSSNPDFRAENLSGAAVEANSSATFDVILNADKTAGSYSTTISVLDGTKLLDSFVVTANVKTAYGVEDILDDTWSPIVAGYTGETKIYTVSNHVTAIPNLNVSCSGSDFNVASLSKDSLSAFESATFEVSLADGKGAGNYSTTVYVNDGMTPLDSFVVSVTVNDQPPYISDIADDVWAKASLGYSDITKSYTINNGAVALTSLSVTVDGSDFSLSSPPPASVDANGAATFSIKFGAGKSLGVYTAQITIKQGSQILDTFGVTQQVIAGFKIKDIADDLLPLLNEGYSDASKTYTIENQGDPLDALSVACTGDDFTVTAPSPTLGINESTQFKVALKPNKRAGLYSTTVTVKNQQSAIDTFKVVQEVDYTNPILLASNDGSNSASLMTAGIAAANVHMIDSEIRVSDGKIIADLKPSANRSAQLIKYDPTFLTGTNSWKLSFDATIESLITLISAAGVGYNGVGIHINVPMPDDRIKTFRVNFGSLNTATKTLKLYISKNTGTNVTALTSNTLFTEYSVVIDNPTSLHKYSFSYDKPTDTFSVHIDGKTVASAVNAGFTNAITTPLNSKNAGLYITNVISNLTLIDTTKPGNSVAFDNFKLEMPASTDQELIDAALEGIRISTIRGNNPGNVKDNKMITDLSLPKANSILGVAFSWQSSATSVLTNDGKVVRPSADTPVSLTVSAKKGAATSTKTLNLLVLEKEQQLADRSRSATTSFVELCDSVDTPVRWARGHTRSYFSFIDSSQKAEDYKVPIPEGRFLAYQKAGFSGESRLLKTNCIPDAGAFIFDLDAKFIELAKPADTQTNAAYRAFTGFSLGATASGRSFFASVNNMSNGLIDIYIATDNMATGSPADMKDMTYQKTTINFTDDRKYHRWGIEFDGKEMLYVLLDGVRVASAITALQPSPLLKPSGVYIYSNNLYAAMDVDSTTNLIYMDNIMVKKPYKIRDVIDDPSSDMDSYRTAVRLYADIGRTFKDQGMSILTQLFDEDGMLVKSSVTALNSEALNVEVPSVGKQGKMKAVFKLLGASGNMIADFSKDIFLFPRTQEVYSGASLTPNEQIIYRFSNFAGLPNTETWRQVSYRYTSGTGGGQVLENKLNSSSIEIPIGLKGWFGIYIGGIPQCEEVKLSVAGTMYSEKLNFPLGTGIVNGKADVTDYFVFAKNFNYEKIKIEVPDSGRTAIAYIKFVSLTQEQIETYQLPNSTEGNNNNMFIDDDGMSGFQGGRFTSCADMRRYIGQIATQANFGNLSFGMGTTTGLNYDSAYAGRSFEGILERFSEKMRDLDIRQVTSMRNIIDENGGRPTAEVLSTEGDKKGVNVFADLRMNFCYGVNSDFPNMNGPKYFEFYDKGYMTSNGINLSYMYPEVRDYFIGVLSEMAGFNSIDGIIIDFSRYPVVVLDEYLNGDIDARREFITQFMRDVRAAIDAKYGKDFNIGVKVIRADSYVEEDENGDGVSLDDSMDVQTWINEGLINTLIVTEKSRETFFDISEFKQMVEGTDVKLIVAIIASDANTIPLTIDQYQLRALDLYRSGADGIMTGTIIPVSGVVNYAYSMLGDKNKLEKWYDLSYFYALNKTKVELKDLGVGSDVDTGGSSGGTTGGSSGGSTGGSSDGEDGSGSAVDKPAALTDAQINSAIEAMKASAAQLAVVDLSASPTDSITLGQSQLKKLAESDCAVRFILKSGNIELSKEYVKTLFEKAALSCDIKLSAVDENGSLRVTVDIVDKLDILKLDGDIGYSIAYLLEDPSDADSIAVYDENGALVPKALYDADSKTVRFKGKSNSTYSIKLVRNAFKDSQGWFRGSIDFLGIRGIIGGRDADVFDPDGKITRAEFVKIIAALTGSKQDKPASPYKDVTADKWFFEAVCLADSLGIVNGYGDLFAPDENITREQMAVIIDRYLKTQGISLSETRAVQFSDESTISEYAGAAVKRLANIGILNGMSGGEFMPKQNATRAEAATVIANLLKQIYKS